MEGPSQTNAICQVSVASPTAMPASSQRRWCAASQASSMSSTTSVFSRGPLVA